MNRRTLNLIALGFVLMNPIAIDAQQQNHISMDSVIDVVTKNNSNIQIAELERRISAANYKQTDAVFLPQVSVSYNAMVTNNPLNAFGFLLQQGDVSSQDFDPAKLNSPGSAHNFGTSIDLKVPLVNLDMVYARKGARLQQNVYKYKLAYTKDYVSFEGKKAYTQLQFTYQLRDILQATLVDVRQILQSVTNFHKQGLVQQSDVLNAQVQVNTVESALSKAESNIQNASEGLHLLMDKSEECKEVYLTDSLTQVMEIHDGIVFSPTRSDIMAMKTALEASKMMEKSSYMAFMPKVNAFGSYQFNSNNMSGFNKKSYLAGLSLTWNLLSGNQNSGKYKSARITTEKVQKELKQLVDKSQLEINKTVRELKDYQLEIKKNQTSVSQADEALRILTNRFNEGLANTTDCLTAQAQLSQQRIALAQAVMAYNITKYYLELLTSKY